jgi:U3 small nucleolar RNA-associated protein 19
LQSNSESAAHLASNSLNFLEGVQRFPETKSDITSFFIEEFSAGQGIGDNETEADQEADSDFDDWRVAFTEEEGEILAEGPTTKEQRVHRLSTTQALHSFPSHRAQFTNCWLALLPQIQGNESLSSRALGILPNGVMPHLNRPTRLHDWVAGCVEFGESHVT